MTSYSQLIQVEDMASISSKISLIVSFSQDKGKKSDRKVKCNVADVPQKDLADSGPVSQQTHNEVGSRTDNRFCQASRKSQAYG